MRILTLVVLHATFGNASVIRDLEQLFPLAGFCDGENFAMLTDDQKKYLKWDTLNVLLEYVPHDPYLLTDLETFYRDNKGLYRPSEYLQFKIFFHLFRTSHLRDIDLLRPLKFALETWFHVRVAIGKRVREMVAGTDFNSLIVRLTECGENILRESTRSESDMYLTLVIFASCAEERNYTFDFLHALVAVERERT